mgnify:FL=1
MNVIIASYKVKVDVYMAQQLNRVGPSRKGGPHVSGALMLT